MDLTITVHEDGTNSVGRYPEFPVDGDAIACRLHAPNGGLRRRARRILLDDPEALAAARTHLGLSGDYSDDEVTQVLSWLEGGIARFLVTYRYSSTEVAA